MSLTTIDFILISILLLLFILSYKKYSKTNKTRTFILPILCMIAIFLFNGYLYKFSEKRIVDNKISSEYEITAITATNIKAENKIIDITKISELNKNNENYQNTVINYKNIIEINFFGFLIKDFEFQTIAYVDEEIYNILTKIKNNKGNLWIKELEN